MRLRTCDLVSLAVVSAVSLCAAEWDSKPFPQWSDDAVLRVVSNSPWAKQIRVDLTWKKREERPFTYKDVPGTSPQGAGTGGSPVGGIGAPKPKMPMDANLILRWSSALPVRQAKALYKFREEKPEGKSATDLIAAPENDYVLEVYGIPAEVAHLGTESVEAITMNSAWLRTRSGRTVKPNKVEAKVNALTLTIFIHFPRAAAITAADKEVECYADLQIFSFRERFKLGPMVYLNHLEL